MMDSEVVVVNVGSAGGQQHPDGGATEPGTVSRRRKLRVVPSSASTTATVPPLHTIAEELNDCGNQSTEPSLASTTSPPPNPNEPPPYPPTTSTNTSSLHPQQASPTIPLPTDQPSDSTETSHSWTEPTPAAPHSAIELAYHSIEMPSYRVTPSAPPMPQQLVIDSEGFAVPPLVQNANLQALSPVPENNSTPPMPGRFGASGLHSQLSPWQALHPSSSMPGDIHAPIPALDGTETLTSSLLYSQETGKYYVEIRNPQSLSSQSFQPDGQMKDEFQHSTSYVQLQPAAEMEHSKNIARDSTALLVPRPDVVSEKRRPHAFFYCTVAMIFVFIICFDFVFLLLCLLPAVWYAHKAAEAKYRRAYDEVVKYGNKALCFDVLGGISHLLFIAAIVTGILLILHYVANAF